MAMNSGRSIQPVTNPVLQVVGNPRYPTMSSGQKMASWAGALQGIAGQNTSSSAKQAEELRTWQEQQAEVARKYNSQEAQKNRDWQERMSSTAHQREVRDLIAAGLNPVLSVTGGSGAAVTSGATASSSAPSGAMGSVDNSATGAIAGLFGSLLSSFLSLEGTRVSAQSNQAIADKYTAMSKYTSELQAQTQLNTANIQAMAQKYTADAHLAGTKYAADQSAAAQKVSASIHAAAQKYGYDVQSMTQKDIAAFNASVNKDLQEAGFKHDFDIKSAFPSNMWQAMGSLGDAGNSNSGRGFSGVLEDLAKGMSTDFWQTGLLDIINGRSSAKGKNS